MKRNLTIRVRFVRLLFIATLAAVPSFALSARARVVENAATAGSPSLPDTPVGERVERATGAGAIVPTGAEFRLARWNAPSIGTIDRRVLGIALSASAAAIRRGDVTDPATLTVIDFSRPSTVARLWVYDLRTRSLLYEELVSHGRGSGVKFATKFSNEPESNQSSIGLFRTAEAYVGKNGYSLRLDGLEPGINDRARERAIVIHGAPYARPAVAKAQGFLGRSLGCPAVRPEVTRELIDTIEGGDLVFAYYPEKKWLASSRYLGDGVAAD